jgi:addiction module HigA family antidote
MGTTKKERVAKATPGLEPTHPGAILREDVLPALGLSVAEAAKELGITRQALFRVLKEQASISPEMALRIGKFCGNGPDLWIRMQAARDVWKAKRRMAAELAKIRTRRAKVAA